MQGAGREAAPTLAARPARPPSGRLPESAVGLGCLAAFFCPHARGGRRQNAGAARIFCVKQLLVRLGSECRMGCLGGCGPGAPTAANARLGSVVSAARILAPMHRGSPSGLCARPGPSLGQPRPARAVWWLRHPHRLRWRPAARGPLPWPPCRWRLRQGRRRPAVPRPLARQPWWWPSAGPRRPGLPRRRRCRSLVFWAAAPAFCKAWSPRGSMPPGRLTCPLAWPPMSMLCGPKLPPRPPPSPPPRLPPPPSRPAWAGWARTNADSRAAARVERTSVV